MESLQKLPIARMMTRSSISPSPQTSQQTASVPVYESTPVGSPRSLRQLSVFFFGATCFVASMAITRRAVYKRTLRVAPKFYEPNTNPHEHFSPFHDALQALNLATLNCTSLGIMSLGGFMWALDFSSLNEAQNTLRSRLNYDIIYQSGETVPESISDILRASKETVVIEEIEESHLDKPR